MVKLCLVGCGGQTNASHGPALERLKAEGVPLDLAAVMDLNPECAQRIRQRYDFAHAYTDLDEMMRAEAPDAVVIAVPPEHAAATCKRVAAYPCKILLEKPPAVSTAQMDDLIAAVGDDRVQVAMNRRHLPLFNAGMRRIAGRPISFISYDMYRVGRAETYFEHTAIHAVDAVRYLGNSDFKYLDVDYQQVEGHEEGVVNFYMTGQLESGTRVRINICPVTGVVVERATLVLKEETLLIHTPIWNGYDTPGSLTVLRGGGEEMTMVGDTQEMAVSNGFYDQMRRFVGAVERGEALAPSLLGQRQSVELCDLLALRASSYRKGQKV